MSSTKRRFSTLAVIAGLLVALGLGSMVAQALGDNGLVGPADLTGSNTLTVSIASNENNASYAADLAKANTTLDVYKVGSRPSTYEFVLDSPYNTQANNALLADAQAGLSDWDGLAQSLRDSITTLGSGSMSVNSTLEGLPDGLYLILPHGVDNTKELKSTSASYIYEFSPILVSLPTKEPNADGIRMTSNTGDWVNGIEVTLKSRRITRYGALEITKNVTEAALEDSTFVFHITGTTPAGDAYDNYASVTIPAGALTGTTTVTHIPAGTKVTVVEEYAAGRYTLGEVEVGEQGDVIIADSTITFSCTNEPSTNTYGGHGIQNNFEFDKVEGNKDWDWTATPSDNAEDRVTETVK